MNDIERREPEPAQAVPSEEGNTEVNFAAAANMWRARAEKAEAALASERAKREEDEKRMCDELMRQCKLAVDASTACRRIARWRDLLLEKLDIYKAADYSAIQAIGPAPDAAALREARKFIDHLSHQPRPCEVSEGDRDDADYEGGYDCIIREARTIAALLRSEPWGEDGR